MQTAMIASAIEEETVPFAETMHVISKDAAKMRTPECGSVPAERETSRRAGQHADGGSAGSHVRSALAHASVHTTVERRGLRAQAR